MKTVVCRTESDTEALGARLARLLGAPAFVALYGGLGAGKTAFTRGMGAALGISEVRSPTFTIVQEHLGEPALLHFDAYRLSDADELFAIGFEEYLSTRALIALEWADRVPDALPPERLDVFFEGSGDEPRRVRLEPRGERYESVVERL